MAPTLVELGTHILPLPQVLGPVICLPLRPQKTLLPSFTLIPDLTTRWHSQQLHWGTTQPLPHCEQMPYADTQSKGRAGRAGVTPGRSPSGKCQRSPASGIRESKCER